MNDSSLLSSEASSSSSDSLDSFSNFDKLKPYDFEPTVSENENTDGEVSLQLCRLCKQREARLASFGKCKAMSTDTESLCCRKKNEVSDEILKGNFLYF